jgi:hypothetical protein
MKTNLAELRARARNGDTQAIEAIRDLALQAIGILEIFTCAPPGHPEIPEAIRAGVAAAHEVAARSFSWPVAWHAIQEIREPQLGVVKKDKDLDGTGAVGRLGIGGKLGIRVDKKHGQKKPRNFSRHSQTGLALDVWMELEAERTNPSRSPHIADTCPDVAAAIARHAAAVTADDPEAGELIVLSKKKLKRDWKQLAAMLEPLSLETLDSWVVAGVELCRHWSGNLTPETPFPGVTSFRMVEAWDSFPWGDAVRSKATEAQVLTSKLRGTKSAVQTKIRTGLMSLIP